MKKTLYLSSKFKKSLNEDKDVLTISGFANTTNKDRVGDVIVREAWFNGMDNYLKNPILLAQHRYDAPIGSMVDYEISNKGLHIEGEIHKDLNPGVFKAVELGILKAFSVGFSVKDADYDSTTDIFKIKELDLLEISVVSIPANQDSLFSVSKSGLQNSNDIKEYMDYRKSFSPKTQQRKEDIDMTKEELDALVEQKLQARIDEENKQKELEAKEKAKKDAIIKEVSAGSDRLIKDLESKLEASEEKFAEAMASMQNEINEKSEELKARHESKMKFTHGDGKERFEKEIEEAALLSKFMRKDVKDTEFGKQVMNKVNTSSSVQVSSADFEQIVSTNLLRDVELELVIKPLFNTVQLQSANQIVPIVPDPGYGTWVTSTDFGTDASSGNEETTTLTEKTLTTYKVASKSYLSVETEEDSIIPMLPILRAQLVRSLAKTIDKAILRGAGSGSDPVTGLFSLATTDSNAITSGTTAIDISDGAKNIDLEYTRRQLTAKYAINPKDVVYIVAPEVYFDLIEDSAWADANLVTAQEATKLNGEVGMAYGSKILVSDQFEAQAATKEGVVAINTSTILIPELRGLRLETEYSAEKQRTVVVASQRLGSNQIFAGGVATNAWIA